MEWLKGRNIEQFNGTCYGTWKFRIKSLLEELQVLSVIEECPPETPDLEWSHKNSVAKCTIVNFLNDALLHLAEGRPTAKSIIDNLDNLFSGRNLRKQLLLRRQLLNLRLQPNVSLLHHFTIFDTLIADLTCSGANLDEMDKICHLLMTLPFAYEKVTASLEKLHEDHFNLGFIKTLLLDHEAKMQIESIVRLKECHSVKESAHVPNRRPRNNYPNGPNKRWKPNNYHNNINVHINSQMYCDYCHRRNHYIQDCRFYKRMMFDNNFNMNNHRHRNGYGENGFPTLPQFAPKTKKRFNQCDPHVNLITPPNVDLTIKEEPVLIKQEPIEIKDEPIWIKQEPELEPSERPVVVKIEPEDNEQGLNGSVTASMSVKTRGQLNGKRKRKTAKGKKKRISARALARHIWLAEKISQVQMEQQATITVQEP